MMTTSERSTVRGRLPWCTAVLVIEEDPSLRRAIRDSLLMRGFFVEAAPTEREALELLQRLRRDVVVVESTRFEILRPALEGVEPALVAIDACGPALPLHEIANQVEHAVELRRPQV